MGNTFMAYDPNLTRGVLAVPGGDWSMLFERSQRVVACCIGAAQGAYSDPRSTSSTSRCSAWAWSPTIRSRPRRTCIQDPLFGKPVEEHPDVVLDRRLPRDQHHDRDDRAHDGHRRARAVGEDRRGASTPAPGRSTNGINVFNEHPTPLPPETNVPPATDNGTHSGINKRAAALRMVESFLEQTQQVVASCTTGGVPVACDCGTPDTKNGPCD